MPKPNKPLEQMTAQERYDLGMSYLGESRFDKAIKALSSIRREEVDPETYADAQLNLGAAYHTQDQLDKAIKVWSNIRCDDDSKTYADAQLNLGIAYHTQDQLDDAITAWKKVREDDPETYAKAQLNLGAAYYAQGKAQFNLGNTYKAQGKLDDAITAWKKVREDDPETYAKAQLNLGEVYSLDKEKEEQSYEAYNNAQEFSYYKPERGFKILKCPQKIRKDLHTLAESTDEVLESLQIIPDFESQVAHYSRASTAFSLFGDEKNDKEPSHFRLSTIRGVNDPTEGLVLRDYWEQQGISETIHTNDTATFVSCFTFNHDSLNQFRLYGKEDGREATGVSLVFKKEFFSEESGALNHIVGASPDPSNKSKENEPDEPGKPENDNKKLLIDKSTLYRCIYLDPETGYWTLAQRDKSTFYREHNEDADAKEKWGKYYESISTKEEDVEAHLFNKENNDDNSVSSILKSIFTEDHLYNKCNKDEKQKILEAIRFILLPLQYLVKHIAFQEEQECRIMYITQFRDKKIHSNREEQKMYVEYKEQVLQHIDKIWLSPGAAKYQDFFRIRLDKEDNDDKVRISQNPFRNKE